MNQPLRGAKGQYGYIRAPDASARAPRKKRESKKKTEPDLSISLASQSDSYNPPGTSGSISSGMVMEGSQGDPNSEWAIKIGNAPPPEWAKRGPDEHDTKRVKMVYVNFASI